MRIVGMASFMNAAGAQAALLRVMEQLRARGHETETWYFYQEQATFAGRPSVYCFFDKPKLTWFEYAQLPWRVLAKLSRTKPDAVVTFLPLACIIGQLAAACAGVRKRIASQRTPSWAHGAVMREGDKVLGQFLYTDNVCVSRSVQESFARYPRAYRKRLSVVENGLDWQGSTINRAEARRKLGLGAQDVAIVASGRMKAQKNYAFMLDAFAQTKGATLLIAGDGPHMTSLVERAKALGIDENVRFLGALEPRGVADLLRAADVFIQTSTFEGLSNATLEAMSEGLAIVASDIPMQRDVLQSGEGAVCGLLLPLSEPDAWKVALQDLISSPALRAELGAAASAHVRARFALSRMIDGFERMLLRTPPSARNEQAAEARASERGLNP